VADKGQADLLFFMLARVHGPFEYAARVKAIPLDDLIKGPDDLLLSPVLQQCTKRRFYEVPQLVACMEGRDLERVFAPGGATAPDDGDIGEHLSC